MACQCFGILLDQRRIHQDFAVALYLRRRLGDGIDLLELVKDAERGDRAALGVQAEQLQRDCDAANIRGTGRSNESHGASILQMSILTDQDRPAERFSLSMLQNSAPCPIASSNAMWVCGSSSNQCLGMLVFVMSR